MAHTMHGPHFFNRHLFFRHNRALLRDTPWRWVMALGIAFVVLGTVGLAMVVLMTLASILLFGILILIGGTAQVVHAFSIPTWSDRISHLLIGLLYLFAGMIIILDPVVASAVFTALLAFALILIGSFRVVLASQNRTRHGWIWPLAGGIISILLGVMILAHWPVTGLWVIGLFVSVEMIFHGWSLIALSWLEKKA